MIRPQVVVFDLGKVLVDFDYRIGARKVAARAALTEEEIVHFIERSPMLLRYETGRLTTREFFAEVRAVTGYQGAFEEFAAVCKELQAVPVEGIAMDVRLALKAYLPMVFEPVPAICRMPAPPWKAASSAMT